VYCLRRSKSIFPYLPKGVPYYLRAHPRIVRGLSFLSAPFGAFVYPDFLVRTNGHPSIRDTILTPSHILATLKVTEIGRVILSRDGSGSFWIVSIVYPECRRARTRDVQASGFGDLSAGDSAQMPDT
jgi:hypothetical protein